MLFRKLLIALLALSLSVALASCGDKDNDNTCSHKDANDDGKCDSCSADFEDGDEEEELVKKNFSFTVKEIGGDLLKNVDLKLTAGQYTVTITSDVSGKATAELYPAKYSIELIRPENEDDDRFNYQLETTELTLSADNLSAEIIIVDNTPNGTKEKPFFISEKTALTLAPGQEIFYLCRGSLESWLEIAGNDLTVSYNGKTLNSESGLVKLNFEREEGKPITATYDSFSVKNNGTANYEGFIEFKYLPGTSGNPYPVTGNSFSASASADNVYYKYVAASSGVLVASAENISVTLVNGSVVSGDTTEAGAAYVYVTAGDEVSILVKGGSGTVNLTTYAGTAENPVPVYGNQLSISIPKDGSVSFTIAAGKYFMITDEDQISVTCADTIYNPNADGEIFFEISGSGNQTVTVSNGLDSANNVNIQLQ